jgi:uncharacterized protein YjiS (DUF1127 family)
MSDLTFNPFTSTRPGTGRAIAANRITAFRIALRTYLTRQALPELTARELTDIGLTRHAALAEVARLPWDTNPEPHRPRPRRSFDSIQQAWQRARTRRLLAEMSAHELRDIGVTPTDAEAEANKPFWRS